jgi:hypothetical protein
MGKAVGDGALTTLDSAERRYRGAYQAGHPDAAGSPKRLDDGDIEQLLAWLEVRDGQVTELFQLRLRHRREQIRSNVLYGGVAGS